MNIYIVTIGYGMYVVRAADEAGAEHVARHDPTDGANFMGDEKKPARVELAHTEGPAALLDSSYA